MRTSIILAVWAVAVASWAKAADEPPAAPAAAPGGIAECVIVIDTSDKDDDAARAYARGCNIDRSNAPLQNAYMRRMLRTGKADAACVPAQPLTISDPHNGVAWALTGYSRGKRGDFFNALLACIQAGQLLENDRGALHNLGQLSAWYDQLKLPPKMKPEDKDAYDKLKGQHASNDAFSTAAAAVKNVLVQQQETRKRIDEDVKKAQAEAQELRKPVATLETQVLDIRRQVADSEQRIHQLNRNINTEQARERPDSTQIRRWRDEKATEERQIRDLKAMELPLFNKGVEGQGKVAAKQQEIIKLNRDLAQEGPAVTTVFTWEPPNVDAAPTALGKTPASGPATPVPAVGDTTATSGAPYGPAGDNEEAAARMLKTAKMYRTNGLEAKALEMLKDIVTIYGDTPAGKEAAELLKKK